MTGRELPESVRALIRTSIPSLDALEVLLFLIRERTGYWGPAEISDRLRPTEVPDRVVSTYLALFQSHGLVVERHGDGFRFFPLSPELDLAAAELVRAYSERPVTLVRTVYDLAEERRLQQWSDAFRLRKDD